MKIRSCGRTFAKKFYRHMMNFRTIIFLFFLASSVALLADTPTPPFPLGKDPLPKGSSGGGAGGDAGDKGQRAPARPVFCSIDFDAAEVNITGYDSAEIESYEICDAESHACIFATNDCAEFVSELSQTQETVYVIFYFSDFTLCGCNYINNLKNNPYEEII